MLIQKVMDFQNLFVIHEGRSEMAVFLLWEEILYCQAPGPQQPGQCKILSENEQPDPGG